ncbi:MFS transporter [Thermococcus sp.]
MNPVSWRMILVSVVIFYSRNIITPVLTVYFKNTLSLSYSQVGYLYSLYLLVMFATDVFTGGIADKYGRRKILTFGMLLYGLSMALIGASHGFLACALAYGLAALGSSLLSGTLQAWYFTEIKAQNLGRDEAKKAYGLLRSINSANSLLIGIITAIIVAFVGMRSVFYAAAILNFFGAFLAILLLNENWGAKEKGILAIVREGVSLVLRNQILRYLFIADMLFTLPHLHFLYVWQLYFTGVLSLKVETLGSLYSLKSAMGILAGFLILWIGMGKEKLHALLFKISISLMLLSYLLFAGVSAEITGVLALALYSLGEAVYFTGYTLLINEVVPNEYRSTIISTRMSISASVGAVFYALIGRLVNFSGLTGSFALMIPVFVLLALVYVKVFGMGESRAFSHL